MEMDICLRRMTMENKPIWKEYEISQLFYIEKGKGNNQKDLLVGINPYVSATNNNNGIVFIVTMLSVIKVIVLQYLILGKHFTKAQILVALI